MSSSSMDIRNPVIYANCKDIRNPVITANRKNILNPLFYDKRMIIFPDPAFYNKCKNPNPIKCSIIFPDPALYGKREISHLHVDLMCNYKSKILCV